MQEQQPIYNNKVGILTKLFMASSVFRLFMAVAAMLVFCVVKRDDLSAIKWFVVVFVAFYLITLVFDALFFAVISKTSNK
ncbi:MAG: hypothetical protein K2G76_03575 [Prevotella sp.]|nr:hypothetical protein [Prevotella sp.]